MRVHPLVLVALSLLAGVAVADRLPGLVVADAHAQTPSAWQCYVVDRLDDPKEAAAWRGAEVTSAGLNVIAPNVATGTLLEVKYPTKASVMSNQGDVALICVK